MNASTDIEYLAGTKNYHNVSSSPTYSIFSSPVIDFLDELSRLFLQSDLSSQFSQVSSFFFYIRRRNLENISLQYLSDEINWGRGLSFHITPSNVAATALYSWLFSLLTGNPSIIRLSNSVSNYLQPILALIDSLYHQYANLLPLFSFVTFPRGSQSTALLSSISDIRLIWGGDQTVELIKSIPAKPSTIDLPFPDRRSFFVLDLDSLPSSPVRLQQDLAHLSKDIVLYSQQACSSPIVLYLKDSGSFSSPQFHNFLELLDQSIASSKYLESTIKDHILSSFDTCLSDNSLYTLFHGDYLSCFFCEPCDLNRILNSDRPSNGNLLATYYVPSNPILPDSSQTAIVYPYTDSHLKALSSFLSCSSLSRFVPPGKAIDMSLFWDGHDIVRMMSKRICGL